MQADTKTQTCSEQSYQYEESKEMDEYEKRMMCRLREKFAGKDGAISDTYALMFVRSYRPENDGEEVTLKQYQYMLDKRKELNIDEILDSDPEGYENYNEILQCGLLGTSKCGRPVYYERLGAAEPRRMRKYGFDNIERCHIRMQEEIRIQKEAISKAKGLWMYKHIVVLDMAGFSFGHMSPDIVRKLRSLMSLDSKVWPESLKKLLIVNAPWIFQKAWSLVKGILHPCTQQKISIIGSNKKKLLEILTEIIDIENIPSFLGGQNEQELSGVCGKAFKSIYECKASPASQQKKKVTVPIAENANIASQTSVSDSPKLQGATGETS